MTRFSVVLLRTENKAKRYSMLRGKGGVEIFQTGTTRRNRRVSFADKSRADRIYYDIHAFTHTYVLKKAYIK